MLMGRVLKAVLPENKNILVLLDPTESTCEELRQIQTKQKTIMVKVLIN